MERLVVITRRYLNVRGSGNGFLSLFISKRLIHGAATALVGVFLPIFLFTTTGENFYIVGGYYALVSFGYVLCIVPATQLMNRIGFRSALLFGGVFSVCTYITLYFIDKTNVWMLLFPLAASIILFRSFHWVPYHVDFAIFTRDGERGRDVSLSYATIAFMGIIGPVLAGYIIQNSGYDVLFAIAVVLLVFATISYAFVPKTEEKFVWKLSETWKKFFSREFRPIMLGTFANGAESAISLIVWPIFLYSILAGDVFEIGAVSTLVAGVTILLQLVLGHYLDLKKGNKERTLRIGSSLYAVGWLIKIFVLSATQVFFVGIYHSITKIFTKTPFDALLYDMTADQGHYVDEYTVLREMGVHLARSITLIVVALLTLVISLQWTFLIAALSAIALNMVYRAVQD